ncbi:heme peroxidase [Corynascus similis CBS 632.67]
MEIKNFFLLTLTTLSPGASRAHPGMLEALAGYSRASEKRDTTELLADLKTLPDSALSPAGLTIKNILLANRAAASPQDLNTVYKPPGPLDSSECRDDTCCVWKYIADAMAAVFQDQKQCNELARQAVRLGFHDAGTWSKSLGGGGADGSVVLSATELARSDNRGLEIAAARMAGWYTEYRSYGVSMADLIQVGAAVATVSCPLGPRSRVFVGRNDSNTPAPSGRLPSVDADAKSLVELFADKTIGVSELVALVGAHTASVQRFVDPLRLGSPQDSTPGTWDVLFYNQMISANPPADVFQFPSDLALSRYSAARESWQTFANGQAVWNDAYAAAYVRLSVLGVKHINDLTECTGVLPLAH